MSAASASFQAGTWLVLRRVGRRHAMGITAAAVAFAAIASYAERKAVVSDAASRALQGPGFGLALPIAAFAVLSCSLGRGRLEAGVSPAAALGAHRRLAALGALVGAAVVAAAIGALIACVTALAGHGPPSAASVSDALTSSWIGALTAACYTFYFGAGASFGAQGGGRVIALGLDLVDVEWTTDRVGWTLRVTIERPGFKEASGGATLEDCVEVSRGSSAVLDLMEDLIPQHYHLEVSSPGLDRKLRGHADFIRFQGQLVKVKLGKPAPDGQRVLRGKLEEATEGRIAVLVDGKRIEASTDDVEEARLVYELQPEPKKGKPKRTGKAGKADKAEAVRKGGTITPEQQNRGAR